MNDLTINSNELLTAQEVAKMLNISASRLAQLRLNKYKYDNEGNLKKDFLPFIKFGSGKRAAVRYEKSEILAFIERNKVSA